MEVFTELRTDARLLLAQALGRDPEGSELEVAGVNYKSSGQGDLFFSRKTADRMRKKLLETVRVHLAEWSGQFV